MRLLEQFKYAVRYGSGKAYLILVSHPELPVDDFLVESALHNYDLDPQCSDHRALYMDELLELRPNYRKLLNQIAQRFKNDEKLSQWDAAQVYELLCGNSTPTKKCSVLYMDVLPGNFPMNQNSDLILSQIMRGRMAYSSSPEPLDISC